MITSKKIESDLLFKLVKSLSPGEKRYFSLTSGGNKEINKKDYLSLFEALDKMKYYDENKLLKKFGTRYGKQFPRLKNYLQSQLMNAMSSYHSSNSKKKKLLSKIDKLEFLQFKGMDQECLSYARQLRRLPELKLYSEDYARVLKIEIQAINNLEQHQEAESVFKELQETGHAIQQEFELRILRNRVYMVELSSDIIRSKDEEAFLNQIISAPILSDLDQIKSITGKVLFCDTWIRYYRLTDSYKERLAYTKLVVDIIDQTKGYIELNPDYYITGCVLNLLQSTYESDLYTEVIPEGKKTKEKIVELKGKIKLPTLTLSFSFVNVYMLHSYIQLKRYRDALELARETIRELPDHQNQMLDSHTILLYNVLSNVFFIHKDYQQALIWINKALSHPNSLSVRRDAFIYGKVLSLIINFELRNTEHLSYVLRSTYYYLRKTDRLYDFEKIVLRLIKHLPDLTDHDEQQLFFGKAKKEIEEICKDKFSRHLLKESVIMHWLDEKSGEITEQSN